MDNLWIMVYIWSIYVVNIWIIYVSGWWLTYPSEKYEFVNWDDELPNMWENKNMFQTTKQFVAMS